MITLDELIRPFAMTAEPTLRSLLLAGAAPWIDRRSPAIAPPSPSSAAHLTPNWRPRPRPAKPGRYSSGAADYFDIYLDEVRELHW